MSSNKKTYGEKLKSRVRSRRILPVIGVYDVFSAALAAKNLKLFFAAAMDSLPVSMVFQMRVLSLVMTWFPLFPGLDKSLIVFILL